MLVFFSCAIGKKTSKELAYIQKNYPYLYPHVLRIQILRRSLKEKLSHAKSKSQVQEIYTMACLQISRKDPLASALHAAYDEVLREVRGTQRYQELPVKEEKGNKKKSQM